MSFPAYTRYLISMCCQLHLQFFILIIISWMFLQLWVACTTLLMCMATWAFIIKWDWYGNGLDLALTIFVLIGYDLTIPERAKYVWSLRSVSVQRCHLTNMEFPFKDMMVWWLSYPYHENHKIKKDCLYIETGLSWRFPIDKTAVPLEWPGIQLHPSHQSWI